MLPGFHAAHTLREPFVAPAAQFPCTERVDDARCLSDASGNWSCQEGFPGERCYTIREVWGTVGCSHEQAYPPCEKPSKPQHHCRVDCTWVNENGFRTACGWARADGTSPTSELCPKAQAKALQICGSKTSGRRCTVTSSG